MTLTGVVKVYSSVRVSRIDVDICVLRWCTRNFHKMVHVIVSTRWCIRIQVHKVVHEVVYLLFCSQCGV